MMSNPWEATSINEFLYFNCPECAFRSKEDISFQAHALQNHERSHNFFSTAIEEPIGNIHILRKHFKGEGGGPKTFFLLNLILLHLCLQSCAY